MDQLHNICGEINSSSQFMLCGNPDMINDMVNLLGTMVLRETEEANLAISLSKNTGNLQLTTLLRQEFINHAYKFIAFWTSHHRVTFYNFTIFVN